MKEIIFNSFAAKRMFIKEQAINAAEIASETEGSIVLRDDWFGFTAEGSSYIYEVRAI